MIRGLQATFLLFFGLAVLTPLTVSLLSLRPYEDDLLRSLRREALREHLEFSTSLENLYFELIRRIQTLDQEYYQWLQLKYFQQTSRGFPGSINPKLWFGGIHHDNGFFQDVLPAQPISVQANYRSKYQQFLKEFRKKVAKRLLNKDQVKNWETKSPLLVQAFVLERDQTRVPLKFTEAMTKAKRDWTSIHPIHPAILYSSLSSTMLWDQILGLAAEIFLFAATGFKDSVEKKRTLKHFFSEDPVATRGKSIPMSIFEQNFQVRWDILPSDWDQEQYLGQGSEKEIFDAVYLSILIDDRVNDLFLSLFEKNPASVHLRDLQNGRAPSKESSPLSAREWRSIQVLEEDLLKSGVSYELFQLKPENPPPTAPVLQRYLSGPNTETKGESPSSLISLSQRIHPTTLFNFFDPFSGNYQLDENQLQSYVSGVLGVHQEKVDLVDLCKVAQKTSQSLHFRFLHPQERTYWWATVTPVHFLRNHVLIQYRTESGSKALIAKSFHQYLLWILLGGIGALIMGFFLSRQMILPIKKLISTVGELEQGSLSTRTSLGDLPNEIGELAGGFDGLASSLENSFHQMETIQNLHSLMHGNSNRELLMRELCKSLQTHYSPALLVMGFFLEVLSENSQDYYFEGRELETCHQDEVLEQILKLFPFNSPKPVSKHLDPENFTWGPKAKITAYFLPSMKESSSEKMCGFLVLFEPLRDCPLEVLDTFCQQAGTIFMKTWLDEIREDTRHGGEIQKELMSRDIPDTGDALEVVSTFIPARNLGGDCFDIIKTDQEGVYGIFVGDVSGKGIGPALFGASAKAYLHSLFYSAPDPGKCLEAVNHFLCQIDRSDLFLTLFLIVFNSADGEFSYASAGHNNMILVREDHSLEHLSARGLPLGMFPTVSYETKQAALLPGESIILYTDGIPELENPRKDLFSQERFETHCRNIIGMDLKTWDSALIEELHQFRRGTPPSDDITMVTLRYLPKKEAS